MVSVITVCTDMMEIIPYHDLLYVFYEINLWQYLPVRITAAESLPSLLECAKVKGTFIIDTLFLLYMTFLYMTGMRIFRGNNFWRWKANFNHGVITKHKKGEIYKVLFSHD